MQSIKIGSTYELNIESLANSGDGVGRIDGRVVFIPNSCPKDFVKIQITQSKKNFLKAKILEILKPSPFRVKPMCSYASECGGCDWQHISYEKQLEEKQQGLIQTLQRLGKIDNPPVSDIIPCSRPLGYRNRIQLQFDKNGFYYHQKSSHKAVYIEQCPLADPQINAEWNNCYKSLKNKQGKVELAIVSNEVKTFKVDENGNSALGFRQVNDLQNQVLIEKTLSFISQNNISSVVDLYCGQGNWSRAIHQKFPEVHCLGIESNPISVGKAQEYAENNLQFLQGKVEKLYQMVDEPKDLVIIDPPRAGCNPEVLEEIQKQKPQWLIYISCHPATLARDIQYLINNKWSLQEIQPIDMFPQTPHLECWCLLQSPL